jgi:hypothetical protein
LENDQERECVQTPLILGTNSLQEDREKTIEVQWAAYKNHQRGKNEDVNAASHTSHHMDPTINFPESYYM